MVGMLAAAALTGCAASPPLTPEESRSMHPTPSGTAASVSAQHVLDVPYVADGEPEQRLDLTVPGGHRGPRPVVLFIHGGAWQDGHRRSFESSEGSNFQALRAKLLARGWATASIGYRFTTKARMPAQLQDVKAATRWVSAHAGRYGLDRERIAVVGESAGGHLAQLLGTTRGVAAAEGDLGVTDGASSRVVAVVSYYGVSDLRHLVADRVAAGCGEGSAGVRSPEGLLIGADPASREGKAAAEAASPIAHVTAESAPTLFLHGTADCVVPQAQSERAAARLRQAGVEAQVSTIDAGHAEAAFYTTPRLQREVLDFLGRRLEG